MQIEIRIQNIMDAYVKNHNFSGTALLRKGQKVFFHRSYGYAHRGFSIPNTIHTKYDTASITKIFTTVAIFKLIEQGLLSLDNKALEILNIPDSEIHHEVTIYHLLTHTSGIADDAEEEAGESYEELFKSTPNYSLKETINYLPQFIYKKANFKPGNGCRYNNCAFILLGLVIEKLTDLSYRDYVQQYVFDAVGMNQTGFYSMDQVEENVAEQYISIINSEDQVVGYRKNIYSYPSIGSADAGALTTAADLDLFIQFLKSGKLLSKKYTDLIFSPQALYREHENYTEKMGFGFQYLINKRTNEIEYIQKDGMNPGTHCIMNYYPKTDTTIILLANQESNVWDLAWDLNEAINKK